MLFCNCAADICLREMRLALLLAKFLGKEIQLLTCAPPPAGNPPSITGIVNRVGCGTFDLRLTRGQPGRIGTFSICHLIGFVPS